MRACARKLVGLFHRALCEIVGLFHRALCDIVGLLHRALCDIVGQSLASSCMPIVCMCSLHAPCRHVCVTNVHVIKESARTHVCVLSGAACGRASCGRSCSSCNRGSTQGGSPKCIAKSSGTLVPSLLSKCMLVPWFELQRFANR